ncbi:MAG TPA: N-acetyl-gamma-glutamyl-phosphate reductase [candidate division Zixibacteria bacterium]|nr:N-acetyl-gamma-glutamyl-phosphate reductase [candidate division Zixibacteria bacterium]
MPKPAADSKSARVAVLGATGYAGVELVRLLLGHPRVRITLLTSQQYAGRKLSDIYPSLAGKCDLTLEEIAPEKVAERADLAFAALPHAASMVVVAELVRRRLRVIDLSADFRLHDPECYRKWYGEHKAPGLLKKAVYGLPEIHRKRIAGATLVANPGCYPTGAVLGLAPLFAEKMVEGGVVVDAKSGVTGAGRSAAVELSFGEVHDNFKAYNVAAHRHTPEMEQELGEIAGRPVSVLFAPHLLPINRGILSTIYVRLKKKPTAEQLLDLYRDHYRDEPFVRVHEARFPETKEVRGTNDCAVGLRYDPRTETLVVITAIDNLVKGAAGQAIQNMNLMCGWPEAEGLGGAALVP